MEARQFSQNSCRQLLKATDDMPQSRNVPKLPSWIIFKNFTRNRFVAISSDVFFQKGINLTLQTGGGLAGVSSEANEYDFGDTMDLPMDLSSGARTMEFDDNTCQTTTSNGFSDGGENNINSVVCHTPNSNCDDPSGKVQVTPYYQPATSPISAFPCEESCSCGAICIPIRKEVLSLCNNGRLHWRLAVRMAVKNTSINGVGTTYDKIREYLILNLSSRIFKFMFDVETIERHLSRKLDQGVKSGRYIIHVTDHSTFYRIRRKDEFEVQTKHQQLRNLMKSLKIHK